MHYVPNSLKSIRPCTCRPKQTNPNFKPLYFWKPSNNTLLIHTTSFISKTLNTNLIQNCLMSNHKIISLQIILYRHLVLNGQTTCNTILKKKPFLFLVASQFDFDEVNVVLGNVRIAQLLQTTNPLLARPLSGSPNCAWY